VGKGRRVEGEREKVTRGLMKIIVEMKGWLLLFLFVFCSVPSGSKVV
jgi:hypothetical protein